MDPVTILGLYAKEFLRGRRLDISSLTEVPSERTDGDTQPIFVSRQTLFEDIMDELFRMDVVDFSLPMEVTFMGEEADDMGGPRRELLVAMMQNIKDKFFVEKEHAWILQPTDVGSAFKRLYYAAGIIIGKISGFPQGLENRENRENK